MVKKASQQAVTAFVIKLKAEFNPEKIILFGSREAGDDRNWTDYHFIIVSSTFEGMHWLDRISRVVKLWDSLSDIDALPYTPQEFKQKSRTSSVVRSATKHRIVIG